MSQPMQPSYCWNGEAGSSWGRVYWTSRVRTSSTTTSDPLSLTRCSCKKRTPAATQGSASHAYKLAARKCMYWIKRHKLHTV